MKENLTMNRMSMLKKTIISIIFLSLNLSANDECLNLNPKDKSSTNKILTFKCDGLSEVKNKNYTKASVYFLKGLAVDTHEAPNYELKLELGETYCKMGKKKEGAMQINQFLCMNALDLEIASCSKQNINIYCPKMTKRQCLVEADFLGDLSKIDKKTAEQKRLRALKSKKSCN
jgi:hypothetical protein